MAKKIYWKDIRQSFSSSLGRFFSIASLMGIGALALVGLKVTTPNMQRTAQEYINSQNTMNLAVMSDYGLSTADTTELNSIEGATVEYGYLTDRTIESTDKAVRIFSDSETVSQYRLVSGKMAEQAGEIALANSMSEDYQIGDKITFTEPAGDNKTLKTHTYTVVGFVDSAEIWDNTAMGNSSAGYGELTGYGVVTKENFDSDVYMIARLSYADLDGVNFYEQTYTDKLTQHKAELDDLLADNGTERLTTLKADGQAEIDKGRKEIADSEQKLADAAQKIADGEQEIADGQSQLASAQNQVTTGEQELASAATQLTDGQAQLDQAAATLASAQVELASGSAILADSKAQLDTALAQLTAGKAQLDTSKSELDTAASQLATAEQTLSATKVQLDSGASELATAEAELASNKAQLDAVAAELATNEAQLQQAKADLQAQMDALTAAGQDPAQNPAIAAASATLTQQEQALEAGKAQYQAGMAGYETGLATYTAKKAEYEAGLVAYETGLADYTAGKAAYETDLAQYQSGLATYEESLAAYEAGLAQYQAGVANYETGLSQYQSGLADYQAGRATLANSYSQYESGLAELAYAKAQIASNQEKISQAIAELESGKADYASQKAEADQKIADAKVDLEEAQKTLDELDTPTYTSYTRGTLPGGDGYATYDTATHSISAVGNIFPVVLYVVAAMVTFTTMTRFVDEERTNAGVFKALGYTNKQIIAKFVIYGLTASLLGTAIGILAGNFILSPMIGNIVSGTTIIGDANLYFYPGYIGLAILLALVSAVLPAYWVACKELTEKPAQLLQPKPPVSGSKILLEKITFIWRRLSFTHKVTARNIFRYKQRMLMTVFGVAGSVALLFAGLGIQSSISGVADTQFGDILRYDMIVAENSRASESEKAELADKLASSQVKSELAVSYQTQEQSISSVSEEQSVSVLVTDQTDKLADFITLRNRSSKETLDLTDDGVILSEKLASLYQAKVGDTLEMPLEGQTVTVTVAGISEMYAGHFVYMTAPYYERLTGQDFTTNAHLMTLTDTRTEQVQQTAADFLDLAGVAGVVQNTSLVKQINTIAGSLQSVMVILIVLSVLLGVVILYNLTNINVAERIRELSTIKVLGFHNKEVTMYIYRETITLSLVGIVTGLIGGFLLHKLILNMIGGSAIMFNPSVALYVYIVPILAITGILAVLGWFVNHKLRHVDMLEALKSVE